MIIPPSPGPMSIGGGNSKGGSNSNGGGPSTGACGAARMEEAEIRSRNEVAWKCILKME